MKIRGALSPWPLLATLFAAPAIAALEIGDPAMPHDFGRQPVGSTYAAQYVSVFNRGSTAVTLLPVRVYPEATATCAAIGCPPATPAPFVASASDGCSKAILQPGQGCSTLVGFVPYRGGAFDGEIVFASEDGQTVRGALKGSGRDDPADCLFDWAERTYPELLTSPGPSIVVQPFYGRCYAGGRLCVAADIYTGPSLSGFAPPSVYLYQNNALSRLGWLSDFARNAGCTP